MHKAARVEYSPLGVIGVIAPWNFPFHNLFCPTLPALFAGNAVVAKVSEWTSWSAAPLAALLHEALAAEGHSPDLVQVITGAAETLTPVVLELGGKDAMIVCADANLEHALNSAMLGVFTHCGQMCVAAERLYVFDAVYDQFVAMVADKVRALRQGSPGDDPG